MIRAALKAVFGLFQTKHTGVVTPPRGYAKICTICRKRSIECLLSFARSGLSCCPSCDHIPGVDGERSNTGPGSSLFWYWQQGDQHVQLSASDGLTPPLLVCVRGTKSHLVVNPQVSDMDRAMGWLKSGGEACLKGATVAQSAIN